MTCETCRFWGHSECMEDCEEALMKMYSRDGKELGTLIAQGVNSKGEMVLLVEGKETYIVGTPKTMVTVRTVEDHYREELVKIEQATGRLRVLRLTYDGPR